MTVWKIPRLTGLGGGSFLKRVKSHLFFFYFIFFFMRIDQRLAQLDFYYYLCTDKLGNPITEYTDKWCVDLGMYVYMYIGT